jgi:hypothetical protein
MTEEQISHKQIFRLDDTVFFFWILSIILLFNKEGRFGSRLCFHPVTCVTVSKTSTKLSVFFQFHLKKETEDTSETSYSVKNQDDGYNPKE